MELSESEPDSAGRRGERAKRRDARYVNNGGKCLGKLSSTGCQHSNWGRLARSVDEGQSRNTNPFQTSPTVMSLQEATQALAKAV